MSLYGDHVMDHYRSPRGRGILQNPTVTRSDANPLCGDTITVQLKIDDAGTIVEAAHVAAGCAISQAGASMLFEELIGKNSKEILRMGNERTLEEFGTTLSISRVKCALLGLTAVKKAILSVEQSNTQDALIDK